jgi:hypothetical protein
MKKPGRGLMVVVLAGMVSACAPVFSDLQSAKLVGKGNVELTPSASTVTFSDEDETEHAQTHLGVQVAAGVSDHVDLRARYERVTAEDEGINVVGFGPKVRLVKDHVAAYLPVGFAFGSDLESDKTWAFHPTLLLTAQPHRLVEVTGSAKYMVPLDEEAGDNLLAFNAGLGLGSDAGRWTLRPEVGILLNPGEDGHFMQYSLGLSVRP